MKTISQKTLATFAFALLAANVFAQPTPPGGGGTNYGSYTNSYTFTPQPYVPGLKLSVPGFRETNLPINLLEADPAGTYDVYAASNLTGAAWNDVLQGTNGQTNFILPILFANVGFFRAARTDPAVGDAGGMSFYFLSDPVNINIIQALVMQGGPAAATAVLVDSTNFAAAVWIPFTATPLVNIGTNEGVHEVWFGFKGTNDIAYWTMETITIDTAPPTIVITNPVWSTTAKPIIQIQGYSTKPLASIYFDVTNAVGIFTNQQGFVTSQFFDTNIFAATTNWFQCFDIPLTNGINTVIIHAKDMAGNITTTNVSIMLDFSGDTNPPVVQVTWPQNGDSIGGDTFTVRGTLDDETAQVFAQTVDTNGVTNNIEGIVERNGKFWLEDLSLNPGTNVVTITAIDAAGNSVATNLTLIQSDVAITIDEVADDQLNLQTTTVTGNVSGTNYSVSVNGVAATVDANGDWSADNVTVYGDGTAYFDVTASVNGSSSSSVKQSSTKDKPPLIYINQHSDNWKESGVYWNGLHWSWGASKAYTAANDDSGYLSYQASGTFFYHDETGIAWLDSSYFWSDTNTTGTFSIVSTNDPFDDSLSGAGYGDIWTPFPYSIPSLSVDGSSVGDAGRITHYYSSINYNADPSPCLEGETNYFRNSKTFMRLKTGGKATSTHRNLFRISASATEYGHPECVGWDNLPDTWNGTPMTNIDPTQIRVLGKNVGNDGNLFTVLPDNATLDLAASAPGKHYSLNVSAQKCKLNIVANGNPLSEDHVRRGAYFCVGQKVTFQAVFSPDISGSLNYTSPAWNYTADYINNHWTDANGCEEYNIAPIPAMSNPTTAWFYNQQTQDATANLGMYCQFNNGQSVYLVRKGMFNVYTPTIQKWSPLWDGPPQVVVESGELSLGSVSDTSGNAPDMSFAHYIQSNFSGAAGYTQLITGEYDYNIPYVIDGYQLDNTEWPRGEKTIVASEFGVQVSFDDGPAVSLASINGITAMDLSVKTYLRFRPDAGNPNDNIFVTLRLVTWGVTASASKSNGVWTVDLGSSTSGPNDSTSNEFPLWTHTTHNILSNYK